MYVDILNRLIFDAACIWQLDTLSSIIYSLIIGINSEKILSNHLLCG